MNQEKSCRWNRICQILILLLWLLNPALFPAKNIPNSAKINRIFPDKGMEDRALSLTYLDSPMGEWGAKNLPKSTFLYIDAESVRKNMKIFNSTTANAIQMKHTTIMYLHESVNQKPLRARNLVFRLNF